MTAHIGRGLGELMRDAEESLAADAEVAPSKIVERTRTRHRRFKGLLWTGVVVGGLAIASAGAGASGEVSAEPSPSPSPSVSPSEDLTVPLESVTIPIKGGPEYEGIDALTECGMDAPEPTGAVEDFGLVIPETEPLSIDTDVLEAVELPQVEAIITYESDESVEAAVAPITLVLIKDGKVAGTFLTLMESQRYWTFGNQKNFYSGASLYPAGDFCPEVATKMSDDEESSYLLNPGDYHVVPVAQVWASEESAALRRLYTSGIEVRELPADYPVDLTPGSWDCQRMVQWGQAPRSCLGDANKSAIVDVEGGTVTLPYSPEDLTRTFDVTLVGEPVPLSIPEPFTVPGGRGYEPIVLDADETLECGMVFDETRQDDLTFDGRVPSEITSVGRGAYSMSALVLPDESGPKTLTFAPGSRVWLTGPVTVDYNYFEDGPGNSAIIGVARLDIAGGDSVEVDRYEGPTPVNFVISNVEMCDNFTPEWGLSHIIIDTDVALTREGAPPTEFKPALLPVYDYDNFG